MDQALFYFLGISAVASAIGVVASRNVVRTAVCLLFTLLSVAGLYFLLAAEFLAAVQLVVYAGGTLILIVFGVMLTSKSPMNRFEPKTGEVALAVVAGTVTLMALVTAIIRTTLVTVTPTGNGYSIERIGEALLSDYLIPFEIASVLLLVVMIGAAYLAKGRRS